MEVGLSPAFLGPTLGPLEAVETVVVGRKVDRVEVGRFGEEDVP